MAKYKFFNFTKNPRGINRAGGGVVVVNPGQTSEPIDVSDAEIVGLEQYFTIVGNGNKAPVKSAGSSDKFDAMSDNELHEFLEQRDGVRRPPNTRRDTLIARAREGEPASDDE